MQLAAAPDDDPWASTVDSVQGMTLERVLVDSVGGFFSHGQSFVSITRSTRPSGTEFLALERQKTVQNPLNDFVLSSLGFSIPDSDDDCAIFNQPDDDAAPPIPAAGLFS